MTMQGSEKGSATTPQTAQQRHWLYGANVAVLVVVAVVLLVFVCYLTDRFSWRRDWTLGGVHSLSPRTRALLQDVDKKGQDFELTSTFLPSPQGGTEKEQTEAAEHWQEVRDLLDEYTRFSGHIKLYRPESRDELETKIKERYQGETKPYDEALADFDKIVDDMLKFYKAEVPQFGALSQQPNLSESDKRQIEALEGQFSTNTPTRLERGRRDVRRLLDSTLPEYTKVKDAIKAILENPASDLGTMVAAAKIEGIAKPMMDYFTSAHDRYQKIYDEVKQYQDRLDKLPALKVDEVIDSIRPDSIVVFGPGAVKVVSSSDVYAFPKGANPQADQPLEFQGEQAVSSALLSMVQPEKTKIVFVNASASGPMTSTGQLADVADRLRKENFEVLDWSPPAPQASPDAPPPQVTPPAEGKGVVWVVMTPDAPNQQQMMMGMPPPDARAVTEAVRKHLEAGGSALFLAEATNPMAAMGGGPSGYAYGDLVRPFGVDVKSQFTVVKSFPGETGRVTQPQVDFSRFPEHEITDPIQSLRTVFFAAPTVVAVDQTKPANVTAQVIVQSDDQDTFASAAYAGETTTFNASTDLKSPVPMGVAAIRDKGNKDKEQRIVVLGDKPFATDQALEYGQPVIYQGQLVTMPAFPGNGELLVNSVLWASGYQNMIALGPKSGVALRIKDITPGTLAAIDWGVLWLGAPALALVIGGLVYFVRRR